LSFECQRDLASLHDVAKALLRAQDTLQSLTSFGFFHGTVNGAATKALSALKAKDMGGRGGRGERG
jgi:hypothetical protein